MRHRKKKRRGSFALVVIASWSIAGCGSERSGAPTAPEIEMETPDTAPEAAEEITDQLTDGYCNERLPGFLRDPESVDPIREAIAVAAGDATEGRYGALKESLEGVHETVRGYRDRPGFDPRDAPVLAGISLCVTQAQGLLEGAVGIVPGSPQLLEGRG